MTKKPSWPSSEENFEKEIEYLPHSAFDVKHYQTSKHLVISRQNYTKSTTTSVCKNDRRKLYHEIWSELQEIMEEERVLGLDSQLSEAADSNSRHEQTGTNCIFVDDTGGTNCVINDTGRLNCVTERPNFVVDDTGRLNCVINNDTDRLNHVANDTDGLNCVIDDTDTLYDRLKQRSATKVESRKRSTGVFCSASSKFVAKLGTSASVAKQLFVTSNRGCGCLVEKKEKKIGGRRTEENEEKKQEEREINNKMKTEMEEVKGKEEKKEKAGENYVEIVWSGASLLVHVEEEGGEGGGGKEVFVEELSNCLENNADVAKKGNRKKKKKRKTRRNKKKKKKKQLRIGGGGGEGGQLLTGDGGGGEEDEREDVIDEDEEEEGGEEIRGGGEGEDESVEEEEEDGAEDVGGGREDVIDEDGEEEVREGGVEESVKEEERVEDVGGGGEEEKGRGGGGEEKEGEEGGEGIRLKIDRFSSSTDECNFKNVRNSGENNNYKIDNSEISSLEINFTENFTGDRNMTPSGDSFSNNGQEVSFKNSSDNSCDSHENFRNNFVKTGENLIKTIIIDVRSTQNRVADRSERCFVGDVPNLENSIDFIGTRIPKTADSTGGQMKYCDKTTVLTGNQRKFSDKTADSIENQINSCDRTADLTKPSKTADSTENLINSSHKTADLTKPTKSFGDTIIDYSDPKVFILELGNEEANRLRNYLLKNNSKMTDLKKVIKLTENLINSSDEIVDNSCEMFAENIVEPDSKQKNNVVENVVDESSELFLEQIDKFVGNERNSSDNDPSLHAKSAEIVEQSSEIVEISGSFKVNCEKNEKSSENDECSSKLVECSGSHRLDCQNLGEVFVENSKRIEERKSNQIEERLPENCRNRKFVESAENSEWSYKIVDSCGGVGIDCGNSSEFLVENSSHNQGKLSENQRNFGENLAVCDQIESKNSQKSRNSQKSKNSQKCKNSQKSENSQKTISTGESSGILFVETPKLNKYREIARNVEFAVPCSVVKKRLKVGCMKKSVKFSKNLNVLREKQKENCGKFMRNFPDFQRGITLRSKERFLHTNDRRKFQQSVRNCTVVDKNCKNSRSGGEILQKNVKNDTVVDENCKTIINDVKCLQQSVKIDKNCKTIRNDVKSRQQIVESDTVVDKNCKTIRTGVRSVQQSVKNSRVVEKNCLNLKNKQNRQIKRNRTCDSTSERCQCLNKKRKSEVVDENLPLNLYKKQCRDIISDDKQHLTNNGGNCRKSSRFLRSTNRVLNNNLRLENKLLDKKLCVCIETPKIIGRKSLEEIEHEMKVFYGCLRTTNRNQLICEGVEISNRDQLICESVEISNRDQLICESVEISNRDQLICESMELRDQLIYTGDSSAYNEDCSSSIPSITKHVSTIESDVGEKLSERTVTSGDVERNYVWLKDKIIADMNNLKTIGPFNFDLTNTRRVKHPLSLTKRFRKSTSSENTINHHSINERGQKVLDVGRARNFTEMSGIITDIRPSLQDDNMDDAIVWYCANCQKFYNLKEVDFKFPKTTLIAHCRKKCRQANGNRHIKGQLMFEFLIENSRNGEVCSYLLVNQEAEAFFECSAFLLWTRDDVKLEVKKCIERLLRCQQKRLLSRFCVAENVDRKFIVNVKRRTEQ